MELNDATIGAVRTAADAVGGMSNLRLLVVGICEMMYPQACPQANPAACETPPYVHEPTIPEPSTSFEAPVTTSARPKRKSEVAVAESGRRPRADSATVDARRMAVLSFLRSKKGSWARMGEIKSAIGAQHEISPADMSALIEIGAIKKDGERALCVYTYVAG